MVCLFMEFSRQEYWSGLPFSSPGNLPDSGIEPRFPALQADSLVSELLGECYTLFWRRKWHPAGVQPRLIQGIRSGDGVGDLFIFIYSSKIQRVIE